MAGAVVGEPPCVVARVDGRVEMIFGDVDADDWCYRGGHLFHVLCLSSGAEPPVSVQGTRKRRGDQTLARPATACISSIRPLPRWRVATRQPWISIHRNNPIRTRQAFSDQVESPDRK